MKTHHINRISHNNNIDIPLVDRLKKVLMLLFILLMYQLLSAQTIDEEINNLSNNYEHERVTVNFLEPKNRVITELSEKNHTCDKIYKRANRSITPTFTDTKYCMSTS